MLKSCCHWDLPPREFFLKGMRLAFGIWLLYVGLVKWAGGPENFVGFIVSDFSKTWSPEFLNRILAWVIIIAEPLLALWLLSGVKQRSAWAATALLMFLLVLGRTILMSPDVIQNFMYFVLCLICAAWSTNACSLACGRSAASNT